MNNLGQSTTISVLSSFLAPLLQFLIESSSIEWRKKLTEHIQEKYLQNKMYYLSSYGSNSVQNTYL
jgi:ABC-type uncharacterized transport system fused permease/ATPase subunit